MCYSFTLLPDRLAITRLAADSPMPTWMETAGFVSVTRTPGVLSIVCAASAVPAFAQADSGWRCLILAGTFPLDSVGVLSAISTPLAEAGIPIFVVSVWSTDCILVREERIPEALAWLRRAGHTVNQKPIA